MLTTVLTGAATLFPVVLVLWLGGTYLYSRDSGRRWRALRLIKIMRLWGR